MIWFLLLTILIIACYLLFAPFYFEANSSTGLFRIRFHKLASARLILLNNSLNIDLKIFWWHKIIDLLTPGNKVKKSGEQKNNKTKKQISIKKFTSIIKSFRINKFYLTIDTGNMQTNGVLYPLFYWIRRQTKRNISVNFINENEIVLETKNNFARILRAYITS